MIWYLLYPFRGTADPPVLTQNHPIRKALSSHGTFVARHWLAWILTSVAIAVLICYPAFFLYENPTTGFSKLPSHVWASARLFGGTTDTQPDVEIRQLWVHGDYMKALDHNVLKEALDIQDSILGERTAWLPSTLNFTRYEDDQDPCPLCAVRKLTWGFHSPLIFWNCSSDQIRADKDLLNTINKQSTRRSCLNITLRPSSVFAGKSFVKRKLTAADALVITLFDHVGPGISQDWNTRFAQLAKDAPNRWSIYPENFQVTRSQLYQFQFKPMSVQDDFILFIAYTLMAAYVLVSLRKLRAFKSKFGLGVTAFIEIGVSIVASFTICGLLKIDLARMPREAYPFVVLTIGLENMFRLVNAVLAYPPESPAIHRIAGALGDVGHLALASAGQNFFILRVLAKVVSPGVASFCTFAAVALIFDFFFHLTFFVAVLSVDVRRMELQDSIDRANLARGNSENSRSERQSWIEALLQGRLPISSRLAGSAISICFVLVMNMHFFDNESTLWALVDSIKSMLARKDRIAEKAFCFSPPPINQARTPAAWLRIQDYNSAQEVIKFIKPDAHTIIARVYDPIAIVLHGSDRTGVPRKTTSYLTTMSTILDKHLYPLILVVILAVAFTTLLLQYLLWNELSEEDTDVDSTPASILSVKTLPKVHKLDIVKLTACSKGHIITIGLDRITAISLFDNTSHTYSFNALNTTKMTPPFWPINEVAIDDNGTWAALCAGDGNVAFWNLPERRLSHFLHANFQGQKPLLFSLITIERSDVERLSLIVCFPDGQVNQFDIQRSTAVQRFHLGQGHLQYASLVRLSSSIKLIAAGRDGHIHVATNHFDEWTLTDLPAACDGVGAEMKIQVIKSLAIAPSIGLLVVARPNSLDVMDLKTHSTVYTLPTRAIRSSTLRILSSQPRKCPVCRSRAAHSISFVYTHGVKGTCVMRTFTVEDEHNSLICLKPHASGETNSCKGFLNATETIHHIEEPGSWEATGGQAVIGIRKLAATPNSSIMATGVDLAIDTDTSFRRRQNFFWLPRLAQPRALSALDAVAKPLMHESEEWEVWTLSSTGEFSSIQLQDAPDVDNELFVACTGPIARLGKRSVVIAFGNMTKVVTLGCELFEEDVDGYDDLTPQFSSARRRKQVIRK